MDEDGTSALRKFAVTWLWSLVSALPSLVLHALEIPEFTGDDPDAGAIILPGLWFLCWGLTSPVFVRILGAAPVVRALPPAERPIDHLPARPSACSKPACTGVAMPCAAAAATNHPLRHDQSLTAPRYEAIARE